MEKSDYGYIQKEGVLKYFISNREVDAKDNSEIKKVLFEKNFNVNLLYSTNQVHGTDIKIINDNNCEINDSDAIITNKINTPIMIYTADCVPLIFFDKKKKVVGLAHAGWKGTFNNIVGKVAEKFANQFGSIKDDIEVVIGPHITVENYEVSKELIEKFSELKIKDYYMNKNNKYFLNLFNINKELLLRSGIKESNIKNTGFCTIRNNDEFYSYRKDNQTTKRIATVIQLEGEKDE
ncbi:peptidoglycan editing factor PgeF [Gemelliphila palaticanis]|uniref:Purine nucleoside phosphorylase n=1 Tax=Gemelliphila palaticanis TaxID=81950 RepID=A0ABX2SYI8_9BACL|nr:peptidoglycan editing factor PgeF [Gemella palaticanis]MBF0715143.1 peptidoglycan editing factor PgeF [Gemella palaticanis]NYS47073.1 peptidoglycan editing factor PgeF [Gemella palaticanis]